jgi:hypothetical protein
MSRSFWFEREWQYFPPYKPMQTIADSVRKTKILRKKTSFLLTFSVVIGSHDDECVFDERYEDQSVDDERESSHKLLLFLALRKSMGEDASVDVKRRGPEISIHDPKALERKEQRHHSRGRLRRRRKRKSRHYKSSGEE